MQENDFFGNKIMQIESPQMDYLRNRDNYTLSARVSRLEYLHKLKPDGMSFIGSDMELIFSYREMQDSFINGQFLSTILLGQS